LLLELKFGRRSFSPSRKNIVKTSRKRVEGSGEGAKLVRGEQFKSLVGRVPEGLTKWGRTASRKRGEECHSSDARRIRIKRGLSSGEVRGGGNWLGRQ